MSAPKRNRPASIDAPPSQTCTYIHTPRWAVRLSELVADEASTSWWLSDGRTSTVRFSASNTLAPRDYGWIWGHEQYGEATKEGRDWLGWGWMGPPNLDRSRSQTDRPLESNFRPTADGELAPSTLAACHDHEPQRRRRRQQEQRGQQRAVAEDEYQHQRRPPSCSCWGAAWGLRARSLPPADTAAAVAIAEHTTRYVCIDWTMGGPLGRPPD